MPLALKGNLQPIESCYIPLPSAFVEWGWGREIKTKVSQLIFEVSFFL